MKPILKISIDPGYDAYKIVIQGDTFTFSSKMLDVTEEIFGVDRRPEGSYYIRTEEQVGERIKDFEYLIGNVTELSMRSMALVESNRKLLDKLQSSSKFVEPIFKISIQGALALALFLKEKKDAESKKADKFTIKKLTEDYYMVLIGVALPNDYVSDSWSSVKSMLKCKHDFKLYDADNDIDIPITYDLSNAKYMVDSQVKCAFFYQFTDDNGIDVPNLKDNLPCVVIDGGYHTFGHFLLDLMLITKAHKSNLDYAMGRVDQMVAGQVTNTTGRTNFTSLQIKQYLASNDDINYGAKKITTEELKKMHKSALIKTAMDSIKFLEKNVELNDVKCLLMTGGTGAAYYKTYCEYFAEHYGDNLVPVLTDKPFHGREIEPVFAVALGLYKELEQIALNLSDEE